MLDQLVESRSHAGEDTRRSSFLLTTFVIMASILMSAWLYSLFAKDYGMGGNKGFKRKLVASHNCRYIGIMGVIVDVRSASSKPKSNDDH